MEVMGGDIGRNIFFVPLTERKQALEKIPWVESASVMRFVPNRLKIEIHERTPVAFARVGSKILLIDSVGTLMDLPAAGKKKYSFPVILGMNPGEPASTRAARMKIYNDLVSQLDAGGTHYSQDLSEVDLSDAEDVKVVASDPQGEVLVHLGSSNYLERYKVYVSHVREWRQQFDKLESVDLRYDRQIIVNPDLQGTVKQAPVSVVSAKAAVAAGMKPAALITRQVPAPKSAATSAATSTPSTKVATKKSVKKAHHKVVAKAQPKAGPPLAQNQSMAKTNPPAAQSSPAPTTAPTTPLVKATPAAPSAAGTVAVKPGSKPSPAIAKGEDHP
jgi:cell division protein FtsQ